VISTRLSVLALVAAIALSALPSVTHAQPRVTEIFPQDGAVLAEAPAFFHMCFGSAVAESVGEVNRFRVVRPDGRTAGLRIVFEPGRFGVRIEPSLVAAPPEGEWTFEWLVTDAETGEAAEGAIAFTVRHGGDPVPEDLPEPCPLSPPAATPTAVPTTPEATPGQDAGDGQRDDGGPDLLAVPLVTLAVIGGATALGLLLYLVRLRVGFWLHRPPGDGQDESGYHL